MSRRPRRVTPGFARRSAVAGLAVAILVVTASVAGAAGCRGASSVELAGLRIMVPNAPGSGYDVTARNVAGAMADAGVADAVEVVNLPGGGGTVGLQRLVYEEGNGTLVMAMGLGLVGAQYQHRSRATLRDVTPVARLLEEPNVLVVPYHSPYQTLAELLAAWRHHPAGFAVGGGSRSGGPDHQAPMLLAQAVGIDPRQVDYRQFDGGGRLLPAMVRGEVDFAVTGLAQNAQQFSQGQLRVLAVTGEQRVAGVDAPTLREAGVDVVFANWRGIVAPPGLEPSDLARLRDAVAELHGSEPWQRALVANGWVDAYLPGDEFGDFLDQQVAQVGELLADLGLTGAAGRSDVAVPP